MIPIGPLRAKPHPDSGDVVVGEFARRVTGAGRKCLVEEISGDRAHLFEPISAVHEWVNQLVREKLP